MSKIRQAMMAAGHRGGSAVDWESVARGMINFTTPFSLPAEAIPAIIGANAFRGRENLTEVTFPNTLTTIKEYAFHSCKGLTSVVIPDSVTSIAQYAFAACRSLINIVLQSTTPPTLENVNAFNNTNNCPIYVPDASVATYKAANNWSALASRIFPLSDLVGVVVNYLLFSALPCWERSAA